MSIELMPPDDADFTMRARNRAARLANSSVWWVVVDGPTDDTAAVMPLREAVENGFPYRWGT